MWLQPSPRLFTAQRHNAFSNGENVGAATCGPRGSPFHLPTRLADGLGPGSDLGHGYPRPCAPSPDRSGELGSPALALRKEGQLRLLLLQTTLYSHEVSPLSTCPGLQLQKQFVMRQIQKSFPRPLATTSGSTRLSAFSSFPNFTISFI